MLETLIVAVISAIGGAVAVAVPVIARALATRADHKRKDVSSAIEGFQTLSQAQLERIDELERQIADIYAKWHASEARAQECERRAADLENEVALLKKKGKGTV